MTLFERRDGDRPALLQRRRLEPLSGYRGRYGYPWRWAVAASFFWRLEHLPFSRDGLPFAPTARWGYRCRKWAEYRGSGEYDARYIGRRGQR